jgi:uncharacterized membrane protein HdeD (DUF308 family)
VNVNTFFADTWWLVLLRGIAALALGVLIIFRPVATAGILMMFLGGYWVIEGCILIVHSIRTRSYLSGWGWGVFAGVLVIFAGAALIAFPTLTAMMSVVFTLTMVGCLALVTGVYTIVNGIRLRKVITHEWSTLLAGAVMIVLAILGLLFPHVATAVFVWALGLTAVAGGILGIIASVRMRRRRDG